MVKNKIKNIFCICVFICFVLFFYLLFQVVDGQKTESPVRSDAIVILGHSLADGSIPSEWLVARLEAGLMLYNGGYADTIIVSGGAGSRDNIPVGQAMEDWLTARGVSAADIISEVKASNTYENFYYVAAVAHEHNINDIIVVTNDFHLYRAYVTAKDFFGNISAYPAHLDMDLAKALAYIKEPFSLVKYYLTDRGRAK